MEAALAEMALDTAEKEGDDDNDFVNDKGLVVSSCNLHMLIPPVLNS